MATTLVDCSGSTFTNIGAYGRCIVYDPSTNIWIAVGHDDVSGSIKYSSNPVTTEWRSVSPTIIDHLNTVVCGKTKTGITLWVAAGVKSDYTAGVMYWSTTPTTAWQAVSFHPFTQGVYYSLCYDNNIYNQTGGWIVGGNAYSSAGGRAIAITEDPSIATSTSNWKLCINYTKADGTPVSTANPFGRSGSCYGLATDGGGNYVAVGIDRQASGANNGHSGNNIYYSVDSTFSDGCWTVVPGSPFGISSSGTNICRGVCFILGTWFAWGSSSDNSYTVMYTTNFTGETTRWAPLRYDPFPLGICYGITYDYQNLIYYAIGAPYTSAGNTINNRRTVRYTSDPTSNNAINWIDVPGESFGSIGIAANSSGANMVTNRTNIIAAIGYDDKGGSSIKAGLVRYTPPPTTPVPTTPAPTTPAPTTPAPTTPAPTTPAPTTPASTTPAPTTPAPTTPAPTNPTTPAPTTRAPLTDNQKIDTLLRALTDGSKYDSLSTGAASCFTINNPSYNFAVGTGGKRLVVFNVPFVIAIPDLNNNIIDPISAGDTDYYFPAINIVNQKTYRFIDNQGAPSSDDTIVSTGPSSGYKINYVSATSGITELKIGFPYTFKNLAGISRTFTVRFLGYP